MTAALFGEVQPSGAGRTVSGDALFDGGLFESGLVGPRQRRDRSHLRAVPVDRPLAQRSSGSGAPAVRTTVSGGTPLLSTVPPVTAEGVSGGRSVAVRRAVVSRASGSGRSGSVRSAGPVRTASPVAPAALELVADAGRGLDRAIAASDPADRYVAAHLGALRAAAAVLATRAKPTTRGRRLSAWELLHRVAPEYGEWATFFAACSSRRQAAQAGIGRLSVREADDMVRQAGEFIDLVRESLQQ